MNKSAATHHPPPYSELEGPSMVAVRSDGYKRVANSDHNGDVRVGELHGESRAYESPGQEIYHSGGQEVHQLYGDEGKRYGARS